MDRSRRPAARLLLRPPFARTKSPPKERARRRRACSRAGQTRAARAARVARSSGRRACTRRTGLFSPTLRMKHAPHRERHSNRQDRFANFVAPGGEGPRRIGAGAGAPVRKQHAQQAQRSTPRHRRRSSGRSWLRTVHSWWSCWRCTGGARHVAPRLMGVPGTALSPDAEAAGADAAAAGRGSRLAGLGRRRRGVDAAAAPHKGAAGRHSVWGAANAQGWRGSAPTTRFASAIAGVSSAAKTAAAERLRPAARRACPVVARRRLGRASDGALGSKL